MRYLPTQAGKVGSGVGSRGATGPERVGGRGTDESEFPVRGDWSGVLLAMLHQLRPRRKGRMPSDAEEAPGNRGRPISVGKRWNWKDYRIAREQIKFFAGF
jgi:hypothetical protein